MGYAGCGILYWREIYERTGGYREDLWGQEDWDFLIQICGLGAGGRRVSGPAYMYRTKTRTRSKHVQARLERGKETLAKILRYNEPVFAAHSLAVIEAFGEMNLELWQALQQSHSAKWQLGQLAASIVNPIRGCAWRARGGRLVDNTAGSPVRAE